MKSPSQNFREILIGTTAIVISIVVFWWIISAVYAFFFGLDKSIASAIVAGMVAVFGIVFAYWKERRKIAEETHRNKKIDVYTPFLNMIFTVMKKTNVHATPDQSNNPVGQYLNSPEFFDTLFELKKGMTFYGSPEVIKAMNIWQIKASNSNSGLDQMSSIGDLLLAMRKDIGLSNRGLTSLSIFQMNISEDIETLKGKS